MNMIFLHPRAAAERWNGVGSLLFTSSTAVYDVSDNGPCDEVQMAPPKTKSILNSHLNFLFQLSKYSDFVLNCPSFFSPLFFLDPSRLWLSCRWHSLFSEICSWSSNTYKCQIPTVGLYCEDRTHLLLGREEAQEQMCCWVLRRRCSKLEGVLYGWLAYIYPLLCLLYTLWLWVQLFSLLDFMSSTSVGFIHLWTPNFCPVCDSSISLSQSCKCSFSTLLFLLDQTWSPSLWTKQGGSGSELVSEFVASRMLDFSQDWSALMFELQLVGIRLLEFLDFKYTTRTVELTSIGSRKNMWMLDLTIYWTSSIMRFTYHLTSCDATFMAQLHGMERILKLWRRMTAFVLQMCIQKF